MSVPGFSAKIKQLNHDKISINKLPVQNCAGSFCINETFRNAIKSADIDNLEIKIYKRFKMVRVKGNLKLTKGINRLLKDIPELFSIFDPKIQYKDGLHKHVLKTYQELLKHPEFQALSERRKNILEFAVLNHDTGKSRDLFKKSKKQLSMHPELSAKLISKRAAAFFTVKRDAQLALKLIRHHHYSENIAKGTMTYKDYARLFTEDEFHLLKIMTDADLLSKGKGVEKRMEENFIFFKEQELVYKEKNHKSGITAIDVYA